VARYVLNRVTGRNTLKYLLTLFFVTTSTILTAQVSVGIRIGPPPPPRAMHIERPRPPQPDAIWVDGYWYPVGNHYKWHDGYWTQPPYPAAHWIGPRHENGMFYQGYWEGDRGRVDHDHRWDHDHNRDRDRSDKHDREDRHH
jgi:hypothetical protein